MTRAAILTPNMTLGGAERWIVSLVRHGRRDLLQWTGVALSGWGGRDLDLCTELASHVRIVGDPPKGPYARSGPAEKHIRHLPTLREAVHEITTDADVLVTWGNPHVRQYVPRGLPVVYVSHGSIGYQQPITQETHGITHLAAVSEAAAEPLRYPNGSPVTVIHNGADTDRLLPQTTRGLQRTAWGCDPTSKVVGYVGRFSNEKNPGAAAAAAAVLGEPWHAVYYGEAPPGKGPAAESLLKSLRRDLGRRVSVNPPIREIGDVYRGLDVLMLASYTEAFSLTLIEAWLCGVPVVATAVGCIPELEAVHGPLVTPVPLNAAPHQLAAACLQAASCEGRQIAAKAKEIAERRWTSQAMAQRWADYLELVVRNYACPDGPLPEFMDGSTNVA